MKNYTITVNGNVYDVTVEENGAGAAPAARPVAGGAESGSCGTEGSGGSRQHPGKGRCGRQGIQD